jgi:hypothetical protein
MATYNAKAIQAAIDSDPAISKAEGKAIHALLKGRTRPEPKPEPEVAACTCGWMDYAEVDFDGPEDAHGAGRKGTQ